MGGKERVKCVEWKRGGKGNPKRNRREKQDRRGSDTKTRKWNGKEKLQSRNTRIRNRKDTERDKK